MQHDELSQTQVLRIEKGAALASKLTFLGAGSAFTTEPGNFQSNMLLETVTSKRKFLIDCGTDIRFSLGAKGLSCKDITDIYVSHLHADHIGGLEYMAFGTHFIPQHKKPKLIISKHFKAPLWDNSLKGGLDSLEGEIADLDTYFDVEAVGNKGKFEWEGIAFQLIQVVHIYTGFAFSYSFGLMFRSGGKTVFITTDTQFAPEQMKKFYSMADIIFHDCETAQFKSGVHAHYSQLKELPTDVKAKMWLYHYQPGPRPDAVADGFLGFVKAGQEFDL